MFKPTAPDCQYGPADEHLLIDLGRAMKGEEVRTAWHTRAGFTYLGQFIDHDLTRDKTKLCERDVDPNKIENHRTPFLDLELVYGDGPKQSPALYTGTRLKVSETAESIVGPVGNEVTLPGGTLRDFPRDDLGKALFADPDDMRNLENVMVMQMQILFAKFHNMAMEQCLDPAFMQLPLTGSRFERAQKLVRWHYQRLVRHEFLGEVLDLSTLQDVRTAGPKIEPYRTAVAQKGLFIPAEFSLATFRFGHSMVRNSYSLNCYQSRKHLKELMSLNLVTAPLSEDWLVEWGRMFLGLPRSSDLTTPSSPMNTTIAPDLHKLEDHTLRLFSLPNPNDPDPFHPELPVRTLLRGARANLPSGQEVADALIEQKLLKSSQKLSPDDLVCKTHVTNDESAEKLKQHPKLKEQTPLFYYVLKEAEVVHRGEQLGPVGSRIVAEVFETILRSDSSSYLSVPGLGSEWKLPKWRFPDGKRDVVDSMRKIVKLVGDDILPQGCKNNSLRIFLDFLPRLGYGLYRIINLAFHSDRA
jgi:hypothetical protein